MKKNVIAYVGGSLIAISWCAQAHGQSRDVSATPAAAEAGIADIVVTAQKRGENLQKTAAAITAINSETLVQRGVVTLADAQMVVPAVRFQKEGNNTQLFIRGVGSVLDLQNNDPVIAFNFNGVYMPREAASGAFFDLASIEVLPGPQGTLYGRGAIGGSVNVQFQRPGFENQGSAILEAGNYNLVHGTMAQDFAFSEHLAIRLAVDYTHRDGYYTSGAEAADDIGGRIAVLYSPNEDMSAYIWATGVKRNGTFPNSVNRSPSGYLTNNPFDDVGASIITKQIAQNLASQGISLGFELGTPQAEDAAYKTYSFGGEFKIGLGDKIQLTYIPGYTKLDSDPFYWLGSMLFANTAHIETMSHELRLTGDSDSINWITGLFYYHQRNSGFIDTYFRGLDNPFIARGSDIRRSVISGVGVFGQATWKVTDGLRLVGGGRYSRDKRNANGFDPEVRLPGGGSTTPWSFRKSYSYIDWKIGLEYDLASRVMVYANAQTAHTPGTYNPISPQGIITGGYDGQAGVSKAKLTAFSGGVKSRFLDNTFQANVEAFYYTYDNLIQQQFNASILFNPLFNAKRSDVYGVQADLVWEPTNNDHLNASVAYNHARNKDFITPNGADFSGLQPPYAPDWMLIGSYTRSFDLGTATLDATIAGRYESSWFASYEHTAGTKQNGSAKLDALLTYNSAKDWTFSIWGKNLTNKTVLSTGAAAGFPGPALGTIEAPRTYGARLSLKY